MKHMYNLPANLQEIGDILSIGIDNNYVVYDSKASIDAFTSKLISRMKIVMRRAGWGNLSDVYMRERINTSYKNIHFHFFSDKVWDQVEIFYKEELNSYLAPDDNNLIIGESEKSVILGSY